MHDGAFPAFFSNCELSSTNDESALVTCVLSMITCDSKRKAGKGSVVSATSCDLTLHMTYHCNYCACLVSYCLVSSINYLCHCVVQFTKSELHSWPNNYRLHHALENVVGLKQGAFHRLASTTRRVILWAKIVAVFLELHVSRVLRALQISPKVTCYTSVMDWTISNYIYYNYLLPVSYFVVNIS